MKKIKPSSRDAIIEAAFQTFSQKPGASLGEVADHAGVGRATLHRHFKSRQFLLNELAQIAHAELGIAIEEAVRDAQSYTDGLKLALAAIIPLANRQWFLSHEPFEKDPKIEAAYTAEKEELLNDIEAAKAEGSFDSELPTIWIAEVYENLIYTAWTLVREEEATPNQAADMAWRTFMNGVSK